MMRVTAQKISNQNNAICIEKVWLQLRGKTICTCALLHLRMRRWRVRKRSCSRGALQTFKIDKNSTYKINIGCKSVHPKDVGESSEVMKRHTLSGNVWHTIARHGYISRHIAAKAHNLGFRCRKSVRFNLSPMSVSFRDCARHFLHREKYKGKKNLGFCKVCHVFTKHRAWHFGSFTVRQPKTMWGNSGQKCSRGGAKLWTSISDRCIVQVEFLWVQSVNFQVRTWANAQLISIRGKTLILGVHTLLSNIMCNATYPIQPSNKIVITFRLHTIFGRFFALGELLVELYRNRSNVQKNVLSSRDWPRQALRARRREPLVGSWAKTFVGIGPSRGLCLGRENSFTTSLQIHSALGKRKHWKIYEFSQVISRCHKKAHVSFNLHPTAVFVSAAEWKKRSLTRHWLLLTQDASSHGARPNIDWRWKTLKTTQARYTTNRNVVDTSYSPHAGKKLLMQTSACVAPTTSCCCWTCVSRPTIDITNKKIWAKKGCNRQVLKTMSFYDI